VDKIRLIKKLGRLPQIVMKEMDRALKLHYELD
jgi:mRNA-degrading endonuclease toxin of MazEF toxin-antitoxin module